MGTIDFEHLYTIKGKPGIWEFKKRVGGARNSFAAFLKYGEIDVYATVKPEDCKSLAQYVIYTNEGEISPEKVIDWLFEDVDKPDFVFDFDSQTEAIQLELMAKYVPNYDSARFKPSHMAKIYKWFNELYNVLNTKGT